MRCVVAGQLPLQVVKIKLTSTTLPRRSASLRGLSSWVVSAKSAAGRITARRGAVSPETAVRAARNAVTNIGDLQQSRSIQQHVVPTSRPGLELRQVHL